MACISFDASNNKVQKSKSKNMNKYYLKVSSFVALFAMCVAMLPAHADGVTLTPNNSGVIDAAQIGADGFATTTVSWTSEAPYATGTVISVTVTWSDTTTTGSIPQHGSSTNLGQCPAASTFDAGATYGTMTATQAQIIIVNTVASGATGNVCVRVPVQDGGVTYVANFSVAVITDNASPDYGAVEYYVNGGNDVLVDASVQPTLEFAIVSSTDPLVNEEQHECHMGTLSLVSVEDCAYRLKVSTNAVGGFQVQIASDQPLATGFATLTDITDDATVTAGTEGYGIEVDGADDGGYIAGAYTNPITLDATGVNNYNVNDSPVPQTADDFMSYSSSFLGTSTLSTTLVTHKAAIDAATVVGYYSQTVTYTISATF